MIDFAKAVDSVEQQLYSLTLNCPSCQSNPLQVLIYGYCHSECCLLTNCPDFNGQRDERSRSWLGREAERRCQCLYVIGCATFLYGVAHPLAYDEGSLLTSATDAKHQPFIEQL